MQGVGGSLLARQDVVIERVDREAPSPKAGFDDVGGKAIGGRDDPDQLGLMGFTPRGFGAKGGQQ